MIQKSFAFATLLAVIGLAPAGSAQEKSGYDCLIEPHRTTELATRELGVLEELLVRRGDTVEPDQIVAHLESSAEEVAVELMRSRAELKAELEEAQVRYEFAKRRVERTSRLLEQATVSSFEHDEATTEALTAELQLQQVQHRQAVAQLELEQATRQLERRTIRSPISGIVVRQLLQVGESVEDRPIFEIAQTDPLNVELFVPISDFGRIEIGDTAQIKPLVPGAEPRTAQVSIVDRVVDAASGTFGVRLEMGNPGLAIPGGVRCEVEFLEP